MSDSNRWTIVLLRSRDKREYSFVSKGFFEFYQKLATRRQVKLDLSSHFQLRPLFNEHSTKHSTWIPVTNDEFQYSVMKSKQTQTFEMATAALANQLRQMNEFMTMVNDPAVHVSSHEEVYFADALTAYVDHSGIMPLLQAQFTYHYKSIIKEEKRRNLKSVEILAAEWENLGLENDKMQKEARSIQLFVEASMKAVALTLRHETGTMQSFFIEYMN
jgi:hypothetical protein